MRLSSGLSDPSSAFKSSIIASTRFFSFLATERRANVSTSMVGRMPAFLSVT